MHSSTLATTHWESWWWVLNGQAPLTLSSQNVKIYFNTFLVFFVNWFLQFLSNIPWHSYSNIPYSTLKCKAVKHLYSYLRLWKVKMCHLLSFPTLSHAQKPHLKAFMLNNMLDCYKTRFFKCYHVAHIFSLPHKWNTMKTLLSFTPQQVFFLST